MRSIACTFAAAALTLMSATAAATPIYPGALVGNTTGAPDSTFLGAPDDIFVGLGGQIVTYDFGAARVQEIAGADLNIYEYDSGIVEFHLVTIEVSLDGISFFLATDVGAAVAIPGAGAHGNSAFRRGYDFSGTGLSEIRYVRVDGAGTSPAGPPGTPGFDLDAIAGIRSRVVSAPEPGIVALMGLGLIGLIGVRRKS